MSKYILSVDFNKNYFYSKQRFSAIRNRIWSISYNAISERFVVCDFDKQ